MTHLGTLVSALVDGQLPPAAAERALAHVAGCAECQGEVVAARAARSVLAAASDVPVAADLTARLLALGSAAPAGPSGPGTPVPHGATRSDVSPFGPFGGSVPLPGTVPVHDVPPGCLDGDVTRRFRVPGRLVAAATACIATFVAGLVVVGEQPDVVPPTQRSYALTLLAQAGSGGSAVGGVTVRQASRSGSASLVAGHARMPAPAVPDGGAPAGLVREVDLQGPQSHAEVLAWMRDHGWVGPGTLPESYAVTALRLHADGALELDLVGPHGLVVVTQRHGRLRGDALAGVPVLEVGGRHVHVVSSAPWVGVWQAGGAVVTVVAEDAPDATLHHLIEAYPAMDYDDGVPARISRGWEVVAGAWAP